MSWTVVIDRKAQRDLRRLDPAIARRIMEAIERTADDESGAIKNMRGREGFRLRVGDWRVLFDLDEGQGGERRMIVARVRHRSQAYR